MDSVLAVRAEALRRDRGWTCAELSRRSGLHHNHVWKLLRGQRVRVEGETIRRLARAYGVTTDYLLGMDLPDADLETPLDPASLAGVSCR